MRIISMIPARYNSTRFPGKLMKSLHGKSVILRTYEAVLDTGLFEEVFVVTDSDLIYQEIVRHGGKALKSKKEHHCGSDRIAEAVSEMDVDIVVNVQGDEPFTSRESLHGLLEVFKGSDASVIDLASLMTVIDDEDDIHNPNTVKVVVDKFNFALYFSRAAIPFLREKNTPVRYFKHKGVYAFRKEALLDFSKWPILPLEASEKLEGLRYLEYGKKIKMVATSVKGVEIDTPEDLEEAKRLWK